MLDAHHIRYQVLELPAEKLGALETARLLGVEPILVYKTIVVKRLKGKHILAVIPGTHQVDLKLLAKAVGEKKLILATEAEAEQLTGLQAGGISPLALVNKGFQVIIAQEAHTAVMIHISGGQRGMNLYLSVKDIAELTRARYAIVSHQEET
jgi:Cys-tRNA(Pro)/Cys-tRNA(Cys) deacylase